MIDFSYNNISDEMADTLSRIIPYVEAIRLCNCSLTERGIQKITAEIKDLNSPVRLVMFLGWFCVLSWVLILIYLFINIDAYVFIIATSLPLTLSTINEV